MMFTLRHKLFVLKNGFTSLNLIFEKDLNLVLQILFYFYTYN